MIPKHLTKVPECRKAIAPYNFVQLPTRIVEAPLPPPQTTYQGHTGCVKCTLTTESPLYIRCGHTLAEFEQELESRKLPNFFYHPSNPKNPILPGSSLRGMLRTLIEVVSFSRITQVSDAQKFFFRAVAAMRDDPLAEPYKKRLKKNTVKAGYLVRREEQWFIRPAQMIDNCYPFVWVGESIVSSALREFIPMTRDNYQPQQFPNISFGKICQKNTRPFAEKVSQDLQKYQYKGVLVSSGNMVEAGQNRIDLKRKNHCLIGQPNEQEKPLPINTNAIADYRRALTKFQKESFNEDYGVLKDRRCVFYCQPALGQEVSLFGHCPNFRIPYQIEGQVQASTALDFIPPKLRDPLIYDLATVLFGFVRLKKGSDDQLPALKGRVSISDAVCKTSGDIWQEKQPIALQLLEAPKPSTFQHYLVQPTAEKSELKHYGSQPGSETVIRGYKLYWHKGKQPNIKHPNPEDVPEAYQTTIKPICPGVEFEFTIHFENLSDLELGALLWVLDVAQDDRYRLSLGMGKPLGMGAVKIKHQLVLSDRQQRYSQLFEDQNQSWYTPSMESSPNFVQAFEDYMLCPMHGISELDHPTESRASKLEDIPRIKMLLAMLSWQNAPPAEQSRYMEIERRENPRIGTDPNEYKERPVLPTPLQVMDDKRRINPLQPDPKQPSISRDSNKNKPILKKQPPRPGSGSGGSNPALMKGPKPSDPNKR